MLRLRQLIRESNGLIKERNNHTYGLDDSLFTPKQELINNERNFKNLIKKID